MRVAGVAGVVAEAVVHPARATDERAVTEDLEGADSEPLVAEPATDTGVEGSADSVVRVCLNVVDDV